MATSSKATNSEERVLRKRLNARTRQQRCRARKREASLVKKIGLAQERSNQVYKNLSSSDQPKSTVPTHQADPHSRHPPPHFRMPFHPAMQYCGPPMRPGMGYPPMMPPPHVMMAMRMGGRMPPIMSMPGPPFMRPSMSPGRPVTVSRTGTEESSEGSPPKDAPKGGVKPSPKTEAAIYGMLSLRSSSSSDSDSEEDSPILKKERESIVRTLPTDSNKPAKKRPVTVFVPADNSAKMQTSQVTAPMPWPVLGLDGPSATILPSTAVLA
jgi:hypothetical protein